MAEPFRWAVFVGEKFLGSYPTEEKAALHADDVVGASVEPLYRGGTPDTDPAPPMNGLKVKVYDVLEDAVESGVSYAFQRVAREKEELTEENITRHVMSSICEVFSFD